jgi:hypothetical protein
MGRRAPEPAPVSPPSPPRPARLKGCFPAGREPPSPPPLGVSTWSDTDVDAMLYAIDVREQAGVCAEAALVTAQLPEASELPTGMVVYVLGASTRPRSFFSRLFGGRASTLSRAARGSALLARGYVAIGAGVDEASGFDVSWGTVP